MILASKMFWGLSEAQDLVHKYNKYNKNNKKTDFNILLYGSGDIRHILQTVAQYRIASIDAEYQVQRLNFYLVDGCVDVVARNLLLLDIVLNEDDSISLLGRTHLFMDTYGNTFIRPVSKEYHKHRSDLFIELLSSEEKAAEYSSSIDLSGLKYRERDQLVDIFNLWRGKTPVDIKLQWNNQLRNYLGQRYDCRQGAFDWDLHMELKYRGGEWICNQEYLDFRETGIAYQFPEFEYSLENKTLVVGQRDKNHKQTSHLMTDMHTGPYPAFGLNCDDEEMTKSSHGQNFYRSTDITERNLLKIMHNIRKLEDPSNEQLRKHKLGVAKLATGGITATEDDNAVNLSSKGMDKLIPIENVKIHFLSPEMIKKLSKLDKYKSFFDIAFVGAGCFQYITDQLMDILKPNGIILFELLQLSLLVKEKRTAFEDQLKDLAKRNHLELMTKLNINKHYTTYDYRKQGDKDN